MRAARLGQRVPGVVRTLFPAADARLAQSAWGLAFASPVGLAAGFDKDFRVLAALSALELAQSAPPAAAVVFLPRARRINIVKNH